MTKLLSPTLALSLSFFSCLLVAHEAAAATYVEVTLDSPASLSLEVPAPPKQGLNVLQIEVSALDGALEAQHGFLVELLGSGGRNLTFISIYPSLLQGQKRTYIVPLQSDLAGKKIALKISRHDFWQGQGQKRTGFNLEVRSEE